MRMTYEVSLVALALNLLRCRTAARGFLFFTLALILFLPAGGRADTIVVPNEYANVEGEWGQLHPFIYGAAQVPYRYQQVFGASAFASLPEGPISISEIRFRLEGTVSRSLDAVLPDFEMRFSTSPNGPNALIPRFQFNVGQDETVVSPRGSLRMQATYIVGAKTQPFAVVIPFTRPFVYDRRAGHLLMDTIFYQSSGIQAPFDSVLGPSYPISSLWGSALPGPSGLPSGSPHPEGLIAQFTYTLIPEPNSAALLGGGAALLVLLKRSNRWKR